MKKLKRLLVLGLTLVMTANMFMGVGYATEMSRPPEVDTEEPQVIETRTLSASTCKKMYQEMGSYSNWTADLASVLVGLMGAGGSVTGGVTYLATVIQKMNFKQTKAELKAGWKSGKGCKMYIYDNAVPCILAL